MEFKSQELCSLLILIALYENNVLWVNSLYKK